MCVHLWEGGFRRVEEVQAARWGRLQALRSGAALERALRVVRWVVGAAQLRSCPQLRGSPAPGGLGYPKPPPGGGGGGAPAKPPGRGPGAPARRKWDLWPLDAGVLIVPSSTRNCCCRCHHAATLKKVAPGIAISSRPALTRERRATWRRDSSRRRRTCIAMHASLICELLRALGHLVATSSRRAAATITCPLAARRRRRCAIHALLRLARWRVRHGRSLCSLSRCNAFAASPRLLSRCCCSCLGRRSNPPRSLCSFH